MANNEWDDWLDEPEPWQVPGSTAWMDGLRTKEDWENRNRVMKQCVPCGDWTEQDRESADAPCANCGATSFDPTSTISLRTFNPLTAKKRKVKGKRK